MSIISNLDLVSLTIIEEHSDIVFSSVNKLPDIIEFNAILSVQDIFNLKHFPTVFTIFLDLNLQTVRLDNIDSIFLVVINSI